MKGSRQSKWSIHQGQGGAEEPYSIEFRGKLCSDTDDQLCTTEKLYISAEKLYILLYIFDDFLEASLIAKCDSDALFACYLLLPLDLYFPAIEGEAHENRTGRTGVEGL